MISQLFSGYAAILFAVGLLLGWLAGVWFLFASYSCNVRLARWSYYLPLLTIRLVVTYPRQCLAPFLLQLFALLLCLPLFFRFLSLFSAIQANGHP
jgi:hypothetical protein